MLGVLAIWIAIVVPLAAAEVFVVSADVPPWPIVVGVAVPLLVFWGLLRVEPVRHHLLGIDTRLVVAVQLWRVIGIAFLFGWAVDDLDAGFAVPAGVGDIATGVAALALLATVQAGALTRRHVVAFTTLGVGDFAVALAMGAAVRPDGLESMPWILFPTLAVPFFAMVHVLNWVQLNELLHAPMPDRSGQSAVTIGAHGSVAGSGLSRDRRPPGGFPLVGDAGSPTTSPR